jgi:hypothetical protein
MYIIPIFHVPLKESVSQIWLFLERNATHLIEVPQAGSVDPLEYAATFAADNGIPLLSAPVSSSSSIFLHVDASHPGLADFYTWREIPPGTTPPKEGWRPFVWSSNDPSLNRFLEEIHLGGDAIHPHTAFSVIEEAMAILPILLP